MQENIEKEKVKLPVLPTGKQHVSFSEFSDWYACNQKHKLKYIEKHETGGSSIHTIFGQSLHSAFQSLVEQRMGKKESELITETIKKCETQFLDEFNQYIEKVVFENPKEKQKLIKESHNFLITIKNIVEKANDWLDVTFPEWEPVHVEYQIYEPITASEENENFYFKGFIDLIIKAPVFRKNRSGEMVKTDKYKYYVLDWKTTSWGWRVSEKQSFKKQAQLLLYKNYYSKLSNIPLDDIVCAWVLAKRTVKNGETPFELVKISSSEEKIKEAILAVRQMITALKLKLNFRNIQECRYCDFRGNKCNPFSLE